MRAKITESYLIGQAAHLSGMTRAMVNYLCRHALLIPTVPGQRGRGRARQYSFGDVVVLRSVAKLLQTGISVSRLKVALGELRRHHPNITRTSLPATFLISDGKQVFFRNGDEVIEDLNKRQYVFAFVLELESVRDEVAAKLPSRAEQKFQSKRAARAKGAL